MDLQIHSKRGQPDEIFIDGKRVDEETLQRALSAEGFATEPQLMPTAVVERCPLPRKA